MAAVWKELRHLRHRDLLQGTLLRAFERDQLECRIIQSDAFRPLLTRWTALLLAAGRQGSAADPHDVPAEVQQQAQASGNSELRWLVRRLASGDAMRRGLPHFPSTLLQQGPQYPFETYDFNYLKKLTGSLKGTELTKKVELPEVKAPKPEPQRDLWADGCLDDDDLLDFRKAPRT
mmetsp:Transcript_86173/g.244335  ORF Transcript_86173/g.244335 Transcript_86173/m.244335 type:complete len:176 (+) Transcript_86173:48-575(+)